MALLTQVWLPMYRSKTNKSFDLARSQTLSGVFDSRMVSRRADSRAVG